MSGIPVEVTECAIPNLADPSDMLIDPDSVVEVFYRAENRSSNTVTYTARGQFGDQTKEHSQTVIFNGTMQRIFEFEPPHEPAKVYESSVEIVGVEQD